MVSKLPLGAFQLSHTLFFMLGVQSLRIKVAVCDEVF